MTSLEFLFKNLLECPKDKFIWYSYFDKAKEMSEIPELLDKEIFNAAFDKYTIEDEIEAFAQGAKWYREQLKQKQ
jgi:hypothetical protein